MRMKVIMLIGMFYLYTCHAQNPIYMKYVDWETDVFVNSLSVERLFDPSDRSINNAIITDSSIIKFIIKELRNSKDTININICEDYRIALLIPIEDSKIDTLAFGECFVMLHNKVFKKVNRNILKVLTQFIGKGNNDDIEFYLKELEKLYKEDN